MAFHECFDFSLQVPANAFLFTLLFGLALRLTVTGVQEAEGDGQEVQGGRWGRIPVVIGAGAVVLCVLALRQGRLPYPHNLEELASLAEARALTLSYPANALVHLSLFSLQKKTSPPPQLLQELRVALWLDPHDSLTRDLYAQALLRQGEEAEGLREISQSVFVSPSLSAHSFLRRKAVPSLDAGMQNAVEDGLKRALAAGNSEAAAELGAFYTALGRFADAGRIFEAAALQEGETEVRIRSLLNAGLAYARAGDEEKAVALLQGVIQTAPRDPRAYQYLATQVFAVREETDRAKAVIAEGIKNGADPVPLFLALAEAAQKVGDREEAKAALSAVLALQPSSFDAHLRLGLLYSQESNFERAALLLRKATRLNPASALAFYYLAAAEEGRYRFSAAQAAYARAVDLDPGDTGFQQRYEAFQRKVAENKK